ncbi:MAG: AsmA family protein, partial [Bdellovibrionales bacterium]|nr:AsmA family protein [Bdellovibrionales bacterium]
KKLLVFLALITILLVGVFVFALTQAGTIIAKFKPELETQVGNALGSKFSVEKIDFVAFPTTSLQLSDLRLEDPRDSNKALSVQGGTLRIGLISLLQGKLDIQTLELISPNISLRQTSKGLLIDGLQLKGPKTKNAKLKTEDQSLSSPDSKRDEVEGKRTPSQGLPSWLAVQLQKIAISGGEIRFAQKPSHQPMILKDIEFSSALSIQDSNVHLANVKFGLNLEETGTLSTTVAEGEYSLGTGSLNASDISLKANHPQAKDISLTLDSIAFDGKIAKIPASRLTLTAPVVGKIATSVKDLQYSLAGQKIEFPDTQTEILDGNLAASGAFSLPSQSGNIVFAASNIHYQTEVVNGKGDIRAENGKLNFQNIFFQLFGGELQMQGTANPFQADLPFSGDIDISKMKLEQMLKFIQPGNPIAVTGLLESLDLKVGGSVKPNLLDSLQAGGSVTIRDGEFTGGNLPAMVLKAIRDVPFLNEALLGAVPEDYQRDLDGNTTPIKLLNSTFSIQEKQILVRTLDMQSAIFSLESAGNIGFDTSLDLDTTFRFIPAFSVAFSSKVKEMKRLMDDRDQLVIPLSLKGKASAPIILPNMKEIMKLGAGQVIKEKASELLDKALGKKKDGTQSKEGAIVEGVGKLFGF